MARKGRTFGSVPPRRKDRVQASIRIRVENMADNKALDSRSYRIYGYTFEEVDTAIGTACKKRFTPRRRPVIRLTEPPPPGQPTLPPRPRGTRLIKVKLIGH